jgi:hypothetical protein
MGIRTKLRNNVEPKLEPSETLQQVFLAQSGPNPYWLFLTYLVFFRIKYWVFAITDRRILIYRAGFFAPSKVKDIAATLPRETKFGPVSGLWARIEIGGTRYWVHKRFQKDVQEADAGATAEAVPAS